MLLLFMVWFSLRLFRWCSVFVLFRAATLLPPLVSMGPPAKSFRKSATSNAENLKFNTPLRRAQIHLGQCATKEGFRWAGSNVERHSGAMAQMKVEPHRAGLS